MIVKFQVTEAQALALEYMFEKINNYSCAGMSRNIGYFCDGDGNFHPDIEVEYPGEKPRELTQGQIDEFKKIAIREDDGDGNLIYDYDSIAWRLHPEYEEVKARLAAREGKH